MFAKVEVNGDDAHPLWAWLRAEKEGPRGGDIDWNFTKFLVGRDGRVLARFGPSGSRPTSRPTSRRRWPPRARRLRSARR